MNRKWYLNMLFWSPYQSTLSKDVMQGKLFQKCTHLLYIKKNQWNILVIGNYYVNYQNYQNLMLLTSSDTKRTLMHLFLFTNSAQRELVSMYTQSIYTTTINFPCITPLGKTKITHALLWVSFNETLEFPFWGPMHFWK